MPRALRNLTAMAVVAGLSAALTGCGGHEPGAARNGVLTQPTAACPFRGPVAVQRIALQPGVGALLVDGSKVWVANTRTGRVTAIQRSTANGALHSFHAGRTPIALAAMPGQLWVADRDGDAVNVVEPVTGNELGRFSVDAPVALQRAAGDVWALSLDDGILYGMTRDLRLNAELQVNVATPIAMTPIGQSMWMLGAGDNGLAPLSLREGRFGGAGVRLPARSVAGLAQGDGALWVADPRGHEILRVAEGSLEVARLPAPKAFSPSSIAYGPCGVWVAAPDGEVARVNPSNGRWTRPRRLARSASAIVTDGFGAWFSDGETGRVVRLQP